MTEHTSILTDLQQAERERKKKTFHKKIRTAQIASLIVSLILVVAVASVVRHTSLRTIIASIITLCFPLTSILSFKRAYPLLFLYSMMFTLFLVFVIASPFFKSSLTDKAILGAVILDVIFIPLDILIIRGTIAAKKIEQLSEQKER